MRKNIKRYMHHYNFRPIVSAKPARREGRAAVKLVTVRWLSVRLAGDSVGGGVPYAIRLVSEVLSSNGSTSQGSICGSTLALMDARRTD